MVQTLNGAPPPHETGWETDLLAGAPGRSGALVSRGFSGTAAGLAGSLITIWPDSGHRHPEQPSGTGAVTLGRATQYSLLRHDDTANPGTPGYLQLTAFDGPRPPEWTATFELGARERIWPVLRAVPGITSALICRGADGSALALTLATSIEALEAALTAIMRTELLPGEDPALLTGPDRVDVQRLVHHDLP
jgi:hypothetical protein